MLEGCEGSRGDRRRTNGHGLWVPVEICWKSGKIFSTEHQASLNLGRGRYGTNRTVTDSPVRGWKQIGGEGMQTTLNGLTSPVRSSRGGNMGGPILVLALCLGASAHAQSRPSWSLARHAVRRAHRRRLGRFPGARGGTFVVGVNGDVLVGDGYTATSFKSPLPGGTPH